MEHSFTVKVLIQLNLNLNDFKYVFSDLIRFKLFEDKNIWCGLE